MYSKLLKARNNPENQCYAYDDEILTLIPTKVLPKKDCKYHFTGVLSGEKSQYGWVSEVETFTLDDFIEKYGFGTSDVMEKLYIKIMLDSVSKQETNTPMAVDFVLRGVMEKQIVLTIHKVFFYDSKYPS